jgi:hypothetical protein
MKEAPVTIKILLLLIGLLSLSILFVYISDRLSEAGISIGALPTVALLGIPSLLMFKYFFPSSKEKQPNSGRFHKSEDDQESHLDWTKKNRWK